MVFKYISKFIKYPSIYCLPTYIICINILLLLIFLSNQKLKTLFKTDYIISLVSYTLSTDKNEHFVNEH